MRELCGSNILCKSATVMIVTVAWICCGVTEHRNMCAHTNTDKNLENEVGQQDTTY